MSQFYSVPDVFDFLCSFSINFKFVSFNFQNLIRIYAMMDGLGYNCWKCVIFHYEASLENAEVKSLSTSQPNYVSLSSKFLNLSFSFYHTVKGLSYTCLRFSCTLVSTLLILFFCFYINPKKARSSPLGIKLSFILIILKKPCCKVWDIINVFKIDCTHRRHEEDEVRLRKRNRSKQGRKLFQTCVFSGVEQLVAWEASVCDLAKIGLWFIYSNMS